MELKRKTALVTGAGRGIGATIAKSFAKEGASVILCSRTEEAEKVAEQIRSTGRKTLAYKVDVSRSEEVQLMVKDALSHFDTIDVLVNNAGIYGPIGQLWKIERAKWMHTIAVNLFGAFNCVTSILPGMIERRKGKIINLAGGGEGPFPRFSAYACSKSALLRLTETLAEELNEYNIDVNSIAPGPVNTRFLDEVLAAGLEAGNSYPKALKQKQEGGVPAERAAELAVFLASDASNKLTGRLLSAMWDDWRNIDVKALTSGSLYQMRRIDAVRFKELG